MESPMDDPYRRPIFTPALFYRDPFAALDWLERAFGFERSMVITDSSGALGHAEMPLRRRDDLYRRGMGRLHREPGLGRRQEYAGRARESAGRHRRPLRARAPSGRGHSRRAGGAVLRRPHLSGPRLRGALLELWPARPRRDARGGRTGERFYDRRLGVSLALDLDRGLVALAGLRRSEVIELLRRRRAAELAEAAGLPPHSPALKAGAAPSGEGRG